MKVGFITPMIAPYRITFFEKLCKLDDIDIVVFHNIKKIDDGRPSYLGKINFPNETYEVFRINFFGFSLLWYINIFSKLKHGKFDVIILEGAPSVLSNWFLGIWAKLHKKKVVFWVCGWEPSRVKLILIIKRFLLKWYYSLGNIFISYGETARNYLKQYQVCPNSIYVAYNGIETDGYFNTRKNLERSANLLRADVPPNSKIFLYVGGIFREKRIDVLLNAFEILQMRYKESILWVIGDGPDLNKMKEFSEGLNLSNVVFHGRITDNVEKYFLAADAFILPGVGGLALNQAMLYDCPCIVSIADGTENDLVIENKTGFRFIEGDYNSLSIEMEKICNLSDSEYQILCKNGRELILLRSNVNNMVGVFKEALHKI